MKAKIPSKFLTTNYRKVMWKNYLKIIKKISRVIPVSSVYLVGSFSSNKKRPADVDLLMLIKTKNQIKEKWAIDLEIVPDNEFGEEALEDIQKWVYKKYGKKNAEVLKLK